MKTTRSTGRLLRITGAAVVTLTAFVSLHAAPSPFGTKSPTARRPDPGESVRLVEGNAAGRSVGSFAGQPVRNLEGHQIGTIKDVMIDMHTGRILYVAVSGNSGAALRLMPFAVLRHATGAHGLTVDIERAEWAKVFAIDTWDFEHATITLSEAERRLLAQQFRQAGAASTDELRGGTQLIPLADLRNKRVSTGAENVGWIRDVIVESDGTSGAAVIAPEGDFAVGEKQFVVPLHQLNLAARDRDPIMTTLKRADFEQALRSRI